jgi:hypothetical protein
MTEEFAALKDLLQAQKLKADFAPWSYKWWERFERLVCRLLNYIKPFQHC